jgi:hypothetical protein
MGKISYSQFSIWASCPYRWKLEYVDGLRSFGNTIHTIFGTAMHDIIQMWLEKYVYAGKENLAKGLDLSDLLKDRLIALFNENTQVDENGNKIFLCDKPTLIQFYTQGCQILGYVQNNREKIFPNKNISLVGIEYKIDREIAKNVRFNGYVDIITKDEETGEYVIIDLKTSTKGWNKYQKDDKTKISQILLYKKFISEEFNVPLTHIRTEYIILKREAETTSPYGNPRVGTFIPPNGRPSVEAAWGKVEEFISQCFDDDGNHKIDSITATPNKDSCKFCPFRDSPEHCAHSYYSIQK